MTKIQMIKSLLEKETDETKIKELNDELITAIREEERSKIEAEANEKAQEAEREDAKAKSTKTEIPVERPRVKVTEPEKYKGVNLKAAIAELKTNKELPSAIREHTKADRDDAEQLVIWGVDHLQKALDPSTRRKALNEGTDTEGAELIPDERRSAILTYARETSVALGECRVIPMRSASITMPREDGKPTMTWRGETSAVTETSAVFGDVTLTAKSLDGYVGVSYELESDTDIPGGIAGYISGAMIEAMAKKIDNAAFAGTGDPVSGMFLSAGYDIDMDSATFASVTDANIRDAIASVDGDDNNRWYMSKNILWKVIAGLRDSTSGDPLYVPNRYDDGPGRIWGDPIRLVSQAPKSTDEAASTGWLLYGDLTGFFVGERLGDTRLRVDPYTGMGNGITKFYLFTRWAFAHALPNKYARIVTSA